MNAWTKISRNSVAEPLPLERKANPNEGSISQKIQPPFEPELDLTPLDLRNGTDVHAVNKNGKTPLHVASEYERPLIYWTFLLTRSVNINAKYKIEKTPLHYVSSAKTSEALITAGADVHDKSSILQRTTLHIVYDYFLTIQNLFVFLPFVFLLKLWFV